MEVEMLLGSEPACQIALTRIPKIGSATTRKLIQIFGDAGSVFGASTQALLQAGLKNVTVAAIKNFRGWDGIGAELLRMRKKGIRLLFFTDKDYPNRLQKIPDAPALLFYKGNANLNAERIVAVIGTRYPSGYGMEVTEKLIRQMVRPGLLIISGLAIGIDAAAHSAALRNGISTVGILGHGLGHVYPLENEGLAKEMINDGGLLTSHDHDVEPESFHFPGRNRIVAGICDALVVVESGKNGGSMLTVDAALEYGKKVFAVPGRIMETRSAGCNALIQQGRARMLTTGGQIAADCSWAWPDGGAGVQGTLLLSSTGQFSDGARRPEEELLALFNEKGILHIDEMEVSTGQSSSDLALLLVRLELTGQISAMPGKRYRLNSPITQA